MLLAEWQIRKLRFYI